jgi:hypothetical protein
VEWPEIFVIQQTKQFFPPGNYGLALAAEIFSTAPVGDAPSISGGNMVHLKHNEYNELHRKDCETSPSIDSMMREVLHMLGNIDFEHEIQMDKLEKCSTDDEFKTYIKKRIRAAHRERREPYVELLTKLRQRQHRVAYQA